MAEEIVLVDGKNFCYRHAFTHKGLSSHGFPTGLLYGGLSGLISVARRLPGVPFVFVWDGDGKTWRHRMAETLYKVNRIPLNKAHSQEVDNLHRQLPLFKGFMKKMGFRAFEVPGLEGDDLVGILAARIIQKDIFEKVYIHSSDKDFYQFIGKRIKVLKGLRDGQLKWAHKEEIEEEFGIPVDKWTEFRAIMGDPSDNIPQVFERVGPKTAAMFITKHGIDVKAASCKAKFVIRKKNVDFGENWAKIKLNYVLSQIPTTWDCPYFSKEVKAELKKVVATLSRKSLLRDATKAEDDETYNYMTRFFARFEMSDLMGRRIELHQLP